MAWGGIHGTVLAVERLVRDRREARGLEPPADTALRRWVGRIVTFHIVCFAWIFFRADSFERAGEVIERLFTAWGSASPLVTSSVVLAIAVGIGGQYVHPEALGRVVGGSSACPSPHRPRAVALVVIDTLGPEGVAPFIYFRF